MQVPSHEQCIRTTWPFFISADPLPAPLPTLEDTMKVGGTANDLIERKLMLSHGFVFRFNDVFALRFFPKRYIKW